MRKNKNSAYEMKARDELDEMSRGLYACKGDRVREGDGARECRYL